MSLKIILVACVAVLTIQTIAGAPHPSRRDQDLKESFAEFLQQDKELSALIQHANSLDGYNPSLSRHIRQVEDDGTSFDEQDVETTDKPGFFDRAAKFVMEVLQRFLKWVNTDN